MTTVQVDRGAIKFVLSGANIMCPGMTSKGGKLEQDFKAGTPVVSTAVHTRVIGPCTPCHWALDLNRCL